MKHAPPLHAMRAVSRLLLVAGLWGPSVLSISGQTHAADHSIKIAATGTGFLVSPQGHILTNSHVVDACSDVEIITDTSKQPVTIAATDQSNDLALLKAVPWGQPALPFRESNRIRLGERVTILGYPLQTLVSTALTLTSGNVSALSGIGNDVRVLQFTAPIQPGNSGGPVLDASGLVIGIVYAKLSSSGMAKATGELPQNVNWALKASTVKEFLDTKEIRYRSEPERSPVELTAIGDAARGAIVRVHCLTSRPTTNPARTATGMSSPRSPDEAIRAAKTLCLNLAHYNPPLKAEATKELLKWGKLRLISDPQEADLVLKIARPRQEGLVCTDPGTAILQDNGGGTDLWSTTKMGSFRCGDSSVGRAIARDLIKYLDGFLAKSK